MAEPDDRPSCCFDEWASANARRARSKETAAPVTGALLAELVRAGLEGRTVLDVGCGTGDLVLATLGRGATRAVGIDLGHGAIEQARALAVERGLADRATFEVGDGSAAHLPRSDVVVLHRVVCCYPDASALLDNTLEAAGSRFAFTAPVDHGFTGLLNRIHILCENAWYAVRRSKFDGFRVFVHDLDEIDGRVRAAGFERVHRGRSRVVWELAVYTRER